MVALIPARAGSKRVPGKNTRLLGGLPLLVWTIRAAQESGVFERIVVSTDDERIRAIAYQYGTYGMYRNCGASDAQPDIEWVMDYFGRATDREESFAILRPTSPLRTAATIQRAFKQFTHHEVHSIRAVQPVTEHPMKQWQVRNGCIVPVLECAVDGTPCHSMPTQALPPYYVQNASLEMAWTFVVKSFGTISGKKISPFFTEGLEGFDINTEDDFTEAESIVAAHPEMIPHVHQQTEA